MGPRCVPPPTVGELEWTGMARPRSPPSTEDSEHTGRCRPENRQGCLGASATVDLSRIGPARYEQ